MRRKAKRALACAGAISLFLTACSEPPVADRQGSAADGADGDAANALEALAADSGVIRESDRQTLIGSYGQLYDGGVDRLCILPGRGTVNTYQAGVEIRIGDEEYCRGMGSVRRAGDLLIFSLAGGRCTITARDEGDRIVMPGAVDQACASLCSARGSLAGVTFPHVAAGTKAGQGVVGKDGEPLCAR